MDPNNAISGTLVLLVLSLITEKIANFLKLHQNRLAIPQTSILFENSRTRAIQYRTMWIGIGLAITSKADLFLVFTTDQPFFWKKVDFNFQANWDYWGPLLGTLLGCILTGFFLSFGSKFFHDLLDLLLQAKNLKRKLSERADWQFDTIEEVDKYLLTNDSAETKAKIRHQLLQFEGVEYYHVNYQQKLIHVFARDQKKVATQIDIPGSLNIASFKVVFLKDKVKEITTLATIKPTLQVANSAPYKNQLNGTCGLIVQDDEGDQKFILTCYHALWNDTMKWSGFAQLPLCKIHSPLNGSEIGKLYLGIKNYKLDIALIAPSSGIVLSNTMPLNKMPKAVRTLTENDVKQGTRLSIFSRTDPHNYRYGVCANINTTANITYPDGIKRDLQKLYQIEAMQNGPFSVGGDSGSLIMDEFDYAVGILVAGDGETTSFAMPLESILNAYNLKLFI